MNNKTKEKVKEIMIGIVYEYRHYYDNEWCFSPEVFVEKYLNNDLPNALDVCDAECIKIMKKI